MIAFHNLLDSVGVESWRGPKVAVPERWREALDIASPGV